MDPQTRPVTPQKALSLGMAEVREIIENAVHHHCANPTTRFRLDHGPQLYMRDSGRWVAVDHKAVTWGYLNDVCWMAKHDRNKTALNDAARRMLSQGRIPLSGA